TSCPGAGPVGRTATRSPCSTARARPCKTSRRRLPSTRRRAPPGAARRSRSMAEPFVKTWKDIAIGFLKVGATAYGGPAIMGIMQAEFLERRQWTSKPHFLEGMALVNVLPGATATQLGIFLGYVRGGWWGGLLAGLCFAVPAFVVMLALTVAYAA